MESEKFQDVVIKKLEKHEEFQNLAIKKLEENEQFQDMSLERLKQLEISSKKNEKIQDMIIKKLEKSDKFQDMALEHMARITQDLTDVKSRLIKVELVLEHNVTQKFDALFEGQKQMHEQMDRIEQKVDRHEDIIIRKVK
jgi:hypothetical protein